LILWLYFRIFDQLFEVVNTNASNGN